MMVLKFRIFMWDSRGCRRENNALDVFESGDMFGSTYKSDLRYATGRNKSYSTL